VKYSPQIFKLFRIEHLSLRIGISQEKIEQIYDNRKSNVNEFILKQKKTDGSIKERPICSPNNEYKSLLKKINRTLLQYKSVPLGICGGVLKKSLSDMVTCHCNKESIYKIDLQDFYPNITKDRIYKFLLHCKCSTDVALLLTDLITYRNCLPQGFPTSTMMANLITYKLDEDQLNICKKYNLLRTRWIDDIIFSGRIKDLEKAIPSINKAVEKNNFILSESKTSFVFRRNNPNVVGLEVSKKIPLVPKSYINTIIEILSFVDKYDEKKAAEIYYEVLKGKNIRKSLQGKIDFIRNYNESDAMIVEKIYQEVFYKKQ